MAPLYLCDVQQDSGTSLNARLSQWAGLLSLSRRGGCLFIPPPWFDSQLHCSSIKSSSWLLNHLYPALKPFNLDGCGLFQNVSAHIHRARGLTEWLAEDENDLNHMLWPSHSPDLSIIEHFIGDLQPMCSIALSNTIRTPTERKNMCRGLNCSVLVARHLNKTLYVGFSFHLSLVSTY